MRTIFNFDDWLAANGPIRREITLISPTPSDTSVMRTTATALGGEAVRCLSADQSACSC